MTMLSPEEWEAVWLTLAVAARAVGFGLPVAVLTAWVLTLYRFPGRSVLNALVHLPMVLPPVVTGWLLLIIFGLRGPIGGPLSGWSRVRARCHARRRDPCLRGDDVPDHGAIGQAVAGRDRWWIGAGSSHAGRRLAGPVGQHHAAAGVARNSGRGDRRLRHLPGRIRRCDHLRRQHPRSDANPAPGDLHRAAGSGRRGEGSDIVDGFACAGASGAVA